MIDLQSNFLKIVKDILQKHIPDRKVVVFGSRIMGTAKKHSDLDLCVMGEEPLSLKTLDDLREDFSESDLPIRVDIVDWASTNLEFKKIISAKNEII